MIVVRYVVSGVRFCTELALLAGAFCAARELSVVLGLLAMVAVAVVWGVLVAPKAGRRLDDPSRLGLEVALFGLAGVGLAAAGYPAAGTALSVIGVATALAVRRVAPGS